MQAAATDSFSNDMARLSTTRVEVPSNNYDNINNSNNDP